MKFSTLTNAQQEVLNIVTSYIRVSDKSPSLREIQKKAIEIKSLRGIALQLDTLEEFGYISRDSKARSIKINEEIFGNNDKLIDIPLFAGTIQAGLPSLFDEYSDEKIPVKLSATKGLTNVYAIKVRGESMIDVGIDEGDIAIITEYVNPSNGDIVIALQDDSLTIKRFRVIDGHNMLFPENKANKLFKPISDNFEVKGKLVNILKPQMVNYFKKLKSFTESSI